jgi:integrase
MSAVQSTDKRIVVWVQRFNDRPHLVLQWNDPDTGKRKSKSAETADEKKAEQARGDLEADLNAGRGAGASAMTWAAFRERFEDEYAAGRRDGTRRKYANVFDLFEELARPGKLRAVNEQCLSKFAAAMRKKEVHGGREGMAPSTMKVTLQMLRTALRWAADQKLIPVCPSFPKVKVPRKRPQPVPVEAFERLLAAAPAGPWRVFLQTAWLAGLRLEEAFTLRREASEEAPYIDLDRDRIILPAELVKADEDQWVPLVPELRVELEALPETADGRVFDLRGPTGRRMALKSVSDRIVRLAKRAGVKLTMRSLRRGFGCRWAGKVPAQVLQRMMRHSDIRVTTEYYANVDEAVEEAMLGPRRNTSRNKTDGGEGQKPRVSDASDGNTTA